MKSELELNKLREAIIYVLNHFEDGVDYIKLFRILYFAQQENLVRYGKVLINDSFHALRHGPVPSYTYKAVQIAEGKNLDGDFSAFNKDIKVSSKTIFATKKSDTDYLSVSDIRSLDYTLSKYKNMESFHLSDISHDEAWKEAFERANDDPQKEFMTVIDIARAGKASPQMVEYIMEKERLKLELA